MVYLVMDPRLGQTCLGSLLPGQIDQGLHCLLQIPASE